MANGAPVCPISRSQAPPAQPGLLQPVPFKAMDLPSLIAAVNNISLAINPLPAFNGLAVSVRRPTVTIRILHEADYQEDSRVTNLVEVDHKNEDGTYDRDQKIYVQRIEQVVFYDLTTNINGGDFLIWNH